MALLQSAPLPLGALRLLSREEAEWHIALDRARYIASDKKRLDAHHQQHAEERALSKRATLAAALDRLRQMRGQHG